MKQIMMAAGVVAALVLVAAVFASIAPQPAAAQNTACYMERGGLRWICTSNGTFSNAGRTLYPGTELTVTTATYTPTVTYWPIKSAAEVTLTLGAGTTGQLLIVENVGGETINLADTGTARLSAAWAAGQYDTLSLLYYGAWTEVARSNN